MSRIGKLPIAIPKGVTVSAAGRRIDVKGPQGALSLEIPEGVTFEITKDEVAFARASDDRRIRALHGMVRARTANMIRGCSEGFRRTLDINGVGYRAAAKGAALDLTLGYSHGISYPLPAGVKAEVTKEGSIVLVAADRAVVGQAAADIRAYRGPEPYKGKGVKYAEETIQRKEGKARGKK
jgi:large subunit ribosomal protein L6